MATVVLLGTRYPDLSIEEEILDGITIVTAVGGSADEIVTQTADADVVIASGQPQFTPDVLDRMSPRAIVRAGIGVDSVNLEAARRNGYTVAYIPDYGTDAVAFHTISLALAAMRQIPALDRLVREGGWGFSDLRPMHLPSSLTFGIIGFGRIGRRTAELARGVGFTNIVVHDPYADIVSVQLSDLLAQSDILALHAPAPQNGSPLIGAAEIGVMKSGSIIVNTARGSLIDPDALAAGLAEGRPRIAALDVFSPEPPDLSPFLGVEDKLILSPHTGWYTEESQADLRKKSAKEALRIINGEPPLNAVVLPEESS